MDKRYKMNLSVPWKVTLVNEQTFIIPQPDDYFDEDEAWKMAEEIRDKYFTGIEIKTVEIIKE